MGSVYRPATSIWALLRSADRNIEWRSSSSVARRVAALPSCPTRSNGPFIAPRARHRSETYQYYTLPFCQPEEGKKYVLEDLGEVLEGDRLVSTPYDIKFREDIAEEELCTKKLDRRDLERLRYAIANDYYFQVGVGAAGVCEGGATDGPAGGARGK